MNSKACGKCLVEKTLDEFHRHKGGKLGRHTYCKGCEKIRSAGRIRKVCPVKRRALNLSSRYGLTESDINSILQSQSNACAICTKPQKKYVVDHCHITKKVRGILCHRCNLIIGGLDDSAFRNKAINYLEKSEGK